MKTIKMMMAAAGLVWASASVYADTWMDESTGITWTYSVVGDHIRIGSGSRDVTAIATSTTGAVVIPDEIADLPVKEI